MNTPVGHWRVTPYMDDSPNLTKGQTQEICFVADGTWYGTMFPNWGGKWFQKGNNAAGNGDRVRLVGNWADGAGNDSAELDFVNRRLMTGPWSEWTDAGSGCCTFWRVQARRLRKRCPKPKTFDLKDKATLRKLRKTDPFGSKKK